MQLKDIFGLACKPQFRCRLGSSLVERVLGRRHVFWSPRTQFEGDRSDGVPEDEDHTACL